MARRIAVIATAVVCCAALSAGPARAQGYNPLAFTSLGNLSASSGTVTINTDTLQITGAQTGNQTGAYIVNPGATLLIGNGTTGGILSNNNNITDNGSVSIARFADRFVALTELPLPVAFDPKTLETAGVVDYDDSLGGLLTTAHPHQDPGTGELINYVAHLGPRNVYRLYAQAPNRLPAPDPTSKAAPIASKTDAAPIA